MPAVLLTDDGRVCRGCDRPKAWAEFDRHPNGVNGRDSQCKACRNAVRAVYLASPHGKQIRARLSAGYRRRHPDRVKAQVASWIAANPTYERDRSKRRYAANPRAVLAATRRWMARNPHRVDAANRKRRAALKGAIPAAGGVTAEQWSEVLATYEGRCAYCFGETPKPHMDHVVPLDKGGLHIKANVAPACAWCNLSKGARLLRDWLWPERVVR
jgi:5-methylcytosine-specific restriction endonuclease McrA